MNSYALTSLAILKVNWDRLGKDYVENFVPFVVECARSSSEEAISLPDMQQMVGDKFKLNFPQQMLKMIIARATKRGYFKRDSGVVYKVQEKCDTLDFRSTKDAIEATYHRVIDSLREYANKSYGRSLSSDDAEDAISAFLADSSLSLLFYIAEGKQNDSPSSSTHFLVASFVKQAQDSGLTLLDDLESLAQGNLIANAMYLPDPGSIKKRFRNTSVYFDTSFIMFAAGFAGPDRAAPCLELLKLLSRYGAHFRCFEGTRNELQGILDACASRLQKNQLRDAYGPTIEYFVETGKSASDLELMSARLPAKLNALGIKVVALPSFDDTEYQVDESGFEDHLKQNIGYLNPNARVHDVDCISAIARGRRGRESRNVEECGALFVTMNTTLARATRQFFQEQATSNAVALAVTDYALANLLWLKDPTIAPALPHKQLIAEAYAAMQPPTNLWKAYLTEIASLEDSGEVTTDDYLLLRHSLSAKAALMDLTDGQEDAFTEGSIKKILEVAKENIRADLWTEVKTEKYRRLETEEKLQSREEETFALRQRLRSAARWIAITARRSLLIVTCPLLAFGILRTFPWALPPLPSFWTTYVTPGVLLLLFLLMLGNLILGTTLRDLANRFEDRVEGMMARVIFKLVGLPWSTEHDNSPHQ